MNKTKPTKEECLKEMEELISINGNENKYRVEYCQDAKEYVVQILEPSGNWLCLHHYDDDNNPRQVTFTWSVTVDVRADFDPCNEKHVAEARREAWMDVHESNGYMEDDGCL